VVGDRSPHLHRVLGDLRRRLEAVELRGVDLQRAVGPFEEGFDGHGASKVSAKGLRLAGGRSVMRSA